MAIIDLVGSNRNTPKFIKRYNDYIITADDIDTTGADKFKGFWRPSSFPECQREATYLVTGAPSTAVKEEKTVVGELTFKVGNMFHWFLPREFEKPKKNIIVHGERLLHPKLFTTGTPDDYTIEDDESFLWDWKTIDLTYRIQWIAIKQHRAINRDEIEQRKYEIMSKPYDNNVLQWNWYAYMSLRKLFYYDKEWISPNTEKKGIPSLKFKEAIEKFKGRGGLIYVSKSPTLFIPFKLEYDKSLIASWIKFFKEANECVKQGIAPERDSKCARYWKDNCEFSAHCYSKKGDKLGKRIEIP